MTSSCSGKQLFCSRPFRWFEVTGGQRFGEVFLCCPSWLPLPVGNLTTHSVDEIWNGPTAQEIRRSILQGTFDYCIGSRCPFLQSVSGPVCPVEELADAELRQVAAQHEVALSFGPQQLNCSFDSSCNLSCPSCRSEVVIELGRKTELEALRAKLSVEALTDIRGLYITGSGDPFGSPFFRRWLQTMRRADIPMLESIHLHTNALLWTPRLWSTIPEEIREVIASAHVSIDAATAATYAVNRRGGVFARLLENLQFVAQLRAEGPLRTLAISMVVQANNFREMVQFVGLGADLSVDVVYFSQLVNWGTFSDEEYQQRAVHLPTHPAHLAFREVLTPLLAAGPFVQLGNLTHIARPD